jgi:hypothetical protein
MLYSRCSILTLGAMICLISVLRLVRRRSPRLATCHKDLPSKIWFLVMEDAVTDASWRTRCSRYVVENAMTDAS